MGAKYVKPLTKKEIEDNDDRMNYSLIVNRVDYIINYIAYCLGDKIDTWYFRDAPEGNVGTLRSSYDFGFTSGKFGMSKYIFPIVELQNCSNPNYYYYDFQSSWLTEDFENSFNKDTLKKEKEKIAKLAQNRKVKKEKIKEQNIKLAQSIKSKLTKEEFALCKKADFKKYTK